KAETILLTGTNTSENHPIFSNYIKEAVLKHGSKLLIIDPRRIDLVDYAELYLQPKPGTDIAWINGLMHIIIKEGWAAADYIEERCEGYAELAAKVEKYTPAQVAGITGLTEDELYAAARLYGQARPASILYAMGITQHTSGTDNVKSLGNLSMLCGNIGVEGGGVNPLRGQNNVQGACDMGGLPNVYTGYQKVDSEDVRAKFAKAWGLEADKLDPVPGLKLTEMFPAAAEGKIKAMYIMGENPLVSDADLAHIEHCVEALEFFVVQDIFLTETARYADVVLPGVSFAEKNGTFVNSERVVQRVRKALTIPGSAREDREIIAELSNRMGYAMKYDSAEAIMREINQLTPSYGGITYDRLEEKGLAWPCPDSEHPGTPILHVNTFSRGKGLFFAIDHQPPAELPDGDYPFILTTGRVLSHFHTGTMTRKGVGLNKVHPEVKAEISPADAEQLGVGDDDLLKISSRRGSIKVKAQISRRPAAGVVFVPFHFHEVAVNRLTNAALDPVAKIPEYKVCAVKVEKA
ncbi:MAG: molybdopterin-dependent oxidoreductase, partial [Deltaproteobacteria bacterium]|nr:molybdopterin-dependent oxidoreductase [Deltaproteobacteria bacterium]